VAEPVNLNVALAKLANLGDQQSEVMKLALQLQGDIIKDESKNQAQLRLIQALTEQIRAARGDTQQLKGRTKVELVPTEDGQVQVIINGQPVQYQKQPIQKGSPVQKRDTPPSPTKPPDKISPVQLNIFDKHCANCHGGNRGDGKPPDAGFLVEKGAKFTVPQYKKIVARLRLPKGDPKRMPKNKEISAQDRGRLLDAATAAIID
jgi:mono/diheme cytochrome c family protein